MKICSNRHTEVRYNATDENGYPVVACPLCEEMYVSDMLRQQVRDLGVTPVDEIGTTREDIV